MKPTRRHLFWIVWAAIAVAMVVGYFEWETNADFLGVVETRTHKLSAQESGRISRINVSLGETVTANQLLVELDTADLDAEQVWLEQELQRQEDQLEADRARYQLEYDKLRLQSDSDALGIQVRRSDLAAKTAEYEAVKTEVNRLAAAEQAGLGRSREMSDLLIRRDSLARYVAAQREALAGHEGGRGTAASADRDRIVASMLSENIEKINEIKLKLKTVETRRASRKVITPSAGRIVNLNYLPGDSVDAFLTILTVEEPEVAYIDVFIPETADRMPRLGERVNIFPHRTGAGKSAGTIVFVDPGYSAIPERLAFRGMLYWARKFRVQMDPNHHLMPGEAVRVELLEEFTDVPAAAADELAGSRNGGGGAAVAGSPTGEHSNRDGNPVVIENSALAKMTYLPAKGMNGPFEPSGAVWLPDIGRYLVVSDDTGEGSTRHAPWVFFVDKDGVVEPEPAVLKGVDEVNDLEAATMSPDGFIYLVSSQNVNKKGNRKEVRQQILKVARDGRNLSVVGSAALYDAVVAAGRGDAAVAPGLGVKEAGGALELNIEGAAWYQGGLLLGLKEPVSAAGAVVWKLDDINRFIESGRLEPGQLRMFGRVELGSIDGRFASLSDIAVHADGNIYLLSTVPEAPDGAQTGRLLRLKMNGDAVAGAETLAVFPGMKPEGLCFTDEASYTVFFDTGAASALFFRGLWATL